jgi:IPT/TIG domain
MKKLPSVVALLLVLTSCNYSPASPTSDGSAAGPMLVSLSPSSGPTGTRVVVRGSGFSPSGNTISFAAMTLDNPSEMPNEPSVIPDLASTDGAITFNVPSLWRPACSYAAQGPCPFARIPTTPGTYRMSVMNAAGTSNAVMFSVTR